MAERVNSLAGVKASGMEARKSSLFLVGNTRPAATGSSLMSFAAPQGLWETGRSKMKLANSYKMDPPARPSAEAMRCIIKTALDSKLEDSCYDPVKAGLWCQLLTDDIKNKVKELNYERYKICVMVSIGEKKEQGVSLGSRCLWDHERDTWASESYQNTTIYAVGNVYAVYYE